MTAPAEHLARAEEAAVEARRLIDAAMARAVRLDDDTVLDGLDWRTVTEAGAA